MKYIEGTDRSQTALFPVSLDQAIEPHNEVRIIDLFVDSLNIEEMGFRTGHQENGRPASPPPKDLLKIYIYGYMNRTRSSRELEKECKRNIELMWLVKCLAPDHNTISNFRRDNPRAIREVFRQTVSIAKNFDLIGGKLLAGDSTKVRAQNSKKNNYNQKKVKRHLEYIEKKLDQYQEQLSEADGDSQAQIQAEIEKQEGRKQFYRDIQQQLDESGQPQVSTSDPESRQMITRNNITEVAYSIQTTVDEKNKLPIDYKVTNQNDSKAMGPMLRRAKAIIGHNDFMPFTIKDTIPEANLPLPTDWASKPLLPSRPFPGHRKHQPPNMMYKILNIVPAKIATPVLRGKSSIQMAPGIMPARKPTASVSSRPLNAKPVLPSIYAPNQRLMGK